MNMMILLNNHLSDLKLFTVDAREHISQSELYLSILYHTLYHTHMIDTYDMIYIYMSTLTDLTLSLSLSPIYIIMLFRCIADCMSVICPKWYCRLCECYMPYEVLSIV